MEICTIGGYEEVGKNMTAVKIGEDVVIFDCGVHLPALIKLQEREMPQPQYTEKMLRGIKAVPNDLILDDLGWRSKVRAIVLGHPHLDHIGAVPYLAQRYPNAEIIATPFTMAVLNSIIEDEKIVMRNKERIMEENTNYILKSQGKLKLEFVNATHSTLGCVFCVLHSKEGKFFYALDFKFDNHPVMGKPTNYRRLKELAQQGIHTLVVDALYSDTDRRTASERIARNMVEDAISFVRGRKTAFFITTFSSHIPRLKSIVDFGRKTNREIVFIGRSLNKYVNCAIKIGKCPFVKNIKLLKYRRQINSFLRKVEKDRGRYLIVCTGHQAEPGSILDRIVNGETDFRFKPGDHLIFSSSIIPVTENIMARKKMDTKLRKIGVRLQTDVHVSGHGGREDLRDLIEILKPKHVIPAHGSAEQEMPLIKLATTELGYILNKTAHMCTNGKVLRLQ